MKRDQKPEKFFHGIFPSVTETGEPRRAKIENAGVGLTALRQSMGVRQAVPIPFLPRKSAVNIRIGRAIRRIKKKGKTKTA